MKIPVGILGATGMVGQRFITLLASHPWFEVVLVAASPKSAGKRYKEAVEGRWAMEDPIPQQISDLSVCAVESDIDKITQEVSLVFSCLDLDKDKIKEIENQYATKGVVVISNNSAHRWTPDVPMIMPEINPDHLNLIRMQRKNRGFKKGFIVVKPNCSVQSYVPLITPLLKFNPKKVVVTTLQAVSGAGKTLVNWPQMQENIIPFIQKEEEKSENEPLKIWGQIDGGQLKLAEGPKISATCIRVPVENGHMASVSIAFEKKPTKEQIISAWQELNPLKGLDLPLAPDPFITIMQEEDRPQLKLDHRAGKGMGISVGRLRESSVLDFSFIALSHNTIRGAAGGAILIAELLKKKGYI